MDNNKLTRLNLKSLKLEHTKRRIMTINNIAFTLAVIMKDHIGLKNAISGDNLFFKVYDKERMPDYVDDFRWDYVRKAMHRLRQATKLFIVSVRNPDGKFEYFVPTDRQEAQIYVDNLERNIKRQKLMQKKVQVAVEEKWHRLDWIEDSKMLRNYKEMLEERELLQIE